jgi:endonuclease/exonuclease/phosphatase family metal-dependent hydrolase
LRCQEAIALRHLINQDLEIPTIVVGDFNDTAHSVTAQIILGPYLHSKAPKEVLEKFIRARLENTHDFARRRSLHGVHYTYIFNGQYETVDHIFVSQHFRKPTGRIVQYQTFTDHLIDRAEGMQPIHTSDHGQVVATLSLFEE